MDLELDVYYAFHKQEILVQKCFSDTKKGC